MDCRSVHVFLTSLRHPTYIYFARYAVHKITTQVQRTQRQGGRQNAGGKSNTGCIKERGFRFSSSATMVLGQHMSRYETQGRIAPSVRLALFLPPVQSR